MKKMEPDIELECTYKVTMILVDVNVMEHVTNIFMSFDRYLFLEVINILIEIGLFEQSEI